MRASHEETAARWSWLRAPTEVCLRAIIRLLSNYGRKNAVLALAALAQAARLRVFRALVVAGQGGLTPGVIATQLALAPATLSFHLKELTHAGLITQERDGRNLIYRAAFDTMNNLLAYLTDHCCQGQPCLDEKLMACIKPARKS